MASGDYQLCECGKPAEGTWNGAHLCAEHAPNAPTKLTPAFDKVAVYGRAHKMWNMGACLEARNILSEVYTAGEVRRIVARWVVTA